ncbi:phosphotransferase family protein [Actinopolyspora saharensis]|uniref:phosphotransferase family protein n=1 Tax=Actinopolyspora saharensis TaxID=995062 RepID=UPI003F667911
MTTPRETADNVLATAAQLAGLDATNAVMIRDGSNVMYQLPGRVVARIGPEHTDDNAARQIEVARWLTDSDLAVVRALDGVPQPTLVGNRPVTWWEQLPEHRPATTAELGSVLRALHALSPPTHPNLPRFDPLAGLEERVAAAQHLPDDDRDWLSQRIQELREQLSNLKLDQSNSVIHGDAWQGNIAVPGTGTPILLDLEHVAQGHPDWDLIPLAVDHVDFARLNHTDYHDFVAAYGGRDVTTSSAFRVFADIQELRWVVFVLGKAANSVHAARETRHRIACLSGEIPRPWTWTAF